MAQDPWTVVSKTPAKDEWKVVSQQPAASSGIPQGRKGTRYDFLPPTSPIRQAGNIFDVARDVFTQSQANAPTALGTATQPFVDILSGVKRGVEDFTQGVPALVGLPGAREYKSQKEAQYQAATQRRLAADAARLATQVTMSYPVGGVAAVPVKALAKAVPAVAPYVAPIISGLETSGFRTGMKPTSMGGEVVNALVRGGTGATTGAATSALTDQDVGAGAGIGAALPLVGVPFGKAVVGALDFFGKKGADVAATAVQSALGPNAPDVIALLNSAPEGMTAKQFLAQDAVQSQLQALGVKNPQVIVGLANAIEQGPDGLLAFAPILKQQAQARTNVLAAQAGGATQTEALTAQEAAKANLNALTAPMRQEALSAANIGGRYIPDLQAQARQLEGQAAADVGTVRRMEGLAPVATKSLPRVERVALEQSERSAAESLVAGKAARDANQIAANIAEAGLKPLDTNTLTSRLTQVLNDTEYAGNDKVNQSVRAILSDVSDWAARNGGIIDAEALYSIQKNTVKETIDTLLRGENPSAKRKVAAIVMTKINPLIDDAIKEAGGVGWLDYKNTYFTGMKDIERRQLSAKLMEMLEKTPEDFIEMVKGNKPEIIKEFFDAGNFDIAEQMGAQMGPSRMTGLKKVADELKLNIAAGELADIGGPAALEILNKDRSIPNKIAAFASTFAPPKVAAAARVASAVKKLYLAPEVEAELITSFKSGKNLAQLVARVPAAKRRQAAIALANPAWWSAPAAATVNALAPANANTNALAQ